MASSQQRVISHWYHLIENLQASSMEFYASVERAIKARQVPDVRLSRVDWREGGLMSARREYFRVGRKRLIFDVCGAPFGTGFFVSWWLVEITPSPAMAVLAIMALFVISLILLTSIFGTALGLILLVIATLIFFVLVGAAVSQGIAWADSLLEIPVVGAILERLFQPVTYYRIDTMLMFQQAIHAAVLEMVDEMTGAKGIRTLSEAERKPIMREFFRQ